MQGQGTNRDGICRHVVSRERWERGGRKLQMSALELTGVVLPPIRVTVWVGGLRKRGVTEIANQKRYQSHDQINPRHFICAFSHARARACSYPSSAWVGVWVGVFLTDRCDRRKCTRFWLLITRSWYIRGPPMFHFLKKFALRNL